ncbi:MAG: DUF4339 domain-containing protein [Verrucomicrobiota bacterium]
MNPTYHLSSQGQVSGPFELSQIRGMWKSGGITADAQICLVGTEDWKPASGLMGTRDDGNLTKLGFLGILIFGINGILGCASGFLIAQLIGLVFLVLAGLCWFKARSISAPPMTWRAPVYAALACVLVGLGVLGWMDHQASQQRARESALIQESQRVAAELKAKRQREIAESVAAIQQQNLEEQRRFWFNYYEGQGTANEDSPFAKEWNALQASKQATR